MQFKNETTPENNEHSEHAIRLEKLKAMQDAGINPWPASKHVTASNQAVHQEYQETVTKEYCVAGRVRIIRHHGKASFVVIQDQSGQLQLYFKQDDLGQELYEQFKNFIDVGDTIWAKGASFKTKTGEVTIKVDEYTLLSKSLFPLPEKFHGLQDIETIYRQRYLDLIANGESRARFEKRSAIIQNLRSFLVGHNFMEVETPMLHPIPGGAVAKPFVTFHNALDQELYLRIAPELYLKRLVVGGFERVFEINRSFRNEGISTRHNPEFTMIELYMAHHDYIFMMKFVEEIFRFIINNVCGTLQIPYGDLVIDFQKPFKRMSIKEAVLEYGHYAPADIAPNVIDIRLKENNITLADTSASWGQKVYALFEHLVEKRLMQPTFITDFPIEVSPLAKRDENDPTIAARFELFMAGMELSNGFNELNDPFDQANRFKAQVDSRKAGDAEAHHYDAEYVHALEYGLPPTVGLGIGIDRLTMIATNASSIKDVILFPTLKKKE